MKLIGLSIRAILAASIAFLAGCETIKPPTWLKVRACYMTPNGKVCAGIEDEKLTIEGYAK